MTKIVADHVAGIEGSGIRDIMEAVWGISEPVVALHVGEPDFATPRHIVAAISKALQRGETRYAPNAGIPPLRDALAIKVGASNKFSAGPENVVVSAGGMQAIFLALAVTLRPGDEVLIPDPGWPNYEMAVRLLGATPVRYPLTAESDEPVDIPTLAALVTQRTRVLVVNSPSNPLGIVFTASTLQHIMEFVDAHELVALSDECYESITFGQEHNSLARWDRHGRVLTCFSFSKSYAMTGVRVGYLVAPDGVAPVAARMQEAVLSCVNTAAQYGALAAVTGPQDVVASMVSAYQERRDEAVRLLRSADVRFVEPHGAFYLWFHIGEGAESSHDWALRLLAERRVAVAPGTTFGPRGQRWARVSLATALPDLTEGLRRIVSFLQ